MQQRFQQYYKQRLYTRIKQLISGKKWGWVGEMAILAHTPTPLPPPSPAPRLQHPIFLSSQPRFRS